MHDFCSSTSVSLCDIINDQLPVVPSIISSMSAVDPDQSILYPINITQPEDLFAISKEIFESYERHLSTATITRQIHENLIAELEASVNSKEAELARLRSCLQIAETKLSQEKLPLDVQDLKVKLEIERSNLLQIEAAYEEEREAKLELQGRIEDLQVEEEFRRDQAIRTIQRGGEFEELSRIEELEAVVRGLKEQLFDSDNINHRLRVQADEKERILEELQKQLNGSLSKRQPETMLMAPPSSSKLPHTSVDQNTIYKDGHESQATIIALAASRREVTELSVQLQVLTSTAKADHNALLETRSELENQWKRADEHYDDIQRIKIHRDQLVGSLARSDAEIADLEGRVAQLESERYALEQEIRHHKEDAKRGDRVLDAVEGANDTETKNTELEDTTARAEALSLSLQAALQKISDLESQLSIEKGKMDQLRGVHEDFLNVRNQYQAESREYQSQIVIYQDRIKLLSNDLDITKHTVSDLQLQIQSVQETASQSIRDAINSRDTLLEESDRRIHHMNRDLYEQTETLESLLKTQAEERQRYEEVIREKAAAEIEVQLSSFQSGSSTAELQRLSKLVSQLKNDDSVKEVKILQLLKSKAELQETMETLEIALDSKQQELELVKRKFGVRGVAGSVSAPERTKIVPNRRRSVELSTAGFHIAAASSTKNSPTRFSSSTPIGTGRSGRPRSSLAMGTPGLRKTSASMFSTTPLQGSTSSAYTDITYPQTNIVTGRTANSLPPTTLKNGTHFQTVSRSETIQSLVDLPNVPSDRSEDSLTKLKSNQLGLASPRYRRSRDDKENILEI